MHSTWTHIYNSAISYLKACQVQRSFFKDFPIYRTKRLQEHGLQQRENHLLYEKRPKCSGRQANFISVSMVDCYPALLILSYGALIAAVVGIIEIIYHRRAEIINKIKLI